MILPLIAAVAQAVQPAPAPSTVLPAAPAMTLGAIGQQRLPDKGCAAFLWSAADRQLVAMATADPASLRVSIGGRQIDLARVTGGTGAGATGAAGEGAGVLGFPASAEYRGGDVTARLTMDVVQQEGLTAGAKVPTGSLQIDRQGQDGLVVPVAGLIGCRA